MGDIEDVSEKEKYYLRDFPGAKSGVGAKTRI